MEDENHRPSDGQSIGSGPLTSQSSHPVRDLRSPPHRGRQDGRRQCPFGGSRRLRLTKSRPRRRKRASGRSSTITCIVADFARAVKDTPFPADASTHILSSVPRFFSRPLCCEGTCEGREESSSGRIIELALRSARSVPSTMIGIAANSAVSWSSQTVGRRE
jgi:hypothetical protein